MNTARQPVNLLGVSATVVAAAGFGVLWALAKGQGVGWHYFTGNLSAPWLLLPLVGVASLGASSRGLKSVGAGLIALVSLIAFYATTATIWHALNAYTLRNNAFLVMGIFFFEPLVSLAYGRYVGAVTGTSMTVGLIESAAGLVVIVASRPRAADTIF